MKLTPTIDPKLIAQYEAENLAQQAEDQAREREESYPPTPPNKDMAQSYNLDELLGKDDFVATRSESASDFVATNVATSKKSVATKLDETTDFVATKPKDVATNVATKPKDVATKSVATNVATKRKTEMIRFRSKAGTAEALKRIASEKGFNDLSDFIRAAISFANKHPEFKKGT